MKPGFQWFKYWCDRKKMKDGSEENKRARRALGRSPEEKVKGQGEAIYRGPLMWGLLDDAIYQIWKL